MNKKDPKNGIEHIHYDNSGQWERKKELFI